jgi:aconitate hydratase
VIAESFERIHRSNLVGMGVLPLEYAEGATTASLGLRGDEAFTIGGLAEGLRPGQQLTVEARGADGSRRAFQVRSRLDNDTDVAYLRHGGILPMVLRQVMNRPS